MNMKKLGKTLPLGAVLLAAVLLGGCGGGGMSGTYQGGAGLIAITFDSGKAYLKTPAGTIQRPYEVDGNRIIIKGPGGNVVLTRNKDGSLDGPMGTLTKKST